MNIEKVNLKRVLDSMEGVDGWFFRSEGGLLCDALMKTLVKFPVGAIVEIGSYLGRSTVALGLTVKMAESDLKVYAIDPHEGKVTYPEGPGQLAPTLDRFKANIDAAGLKDVVMPIIMKAHEVRWDKGITFLFIDGLHDYENVRRDFKLYEKWVAPGGRIAFHDYSSYPGVTRCVDEILAGKDYIKESQVVSLVVLRKMA